MYQIQRNNTTGNRFQSSFHAVFTVPYKPDGAEHAGGGPNEIQLNDGPQPEAAQWWRLLLSSKVTFGIRNVDEVAA